MPPLCRRFSKELFFLIELAAGNSLGSDLVRVQDFPESGNFRIKGGYYRLLVDLAPVFTSVVGFPVVLKESQFFPNSRFSHSDIAIQIVGWRLFIFRLEWPAVDEFNLLAWCRR